MSWGHRVAVQGSRVAGAAAVSLLHRVVMVLCVGTVVVLWLTH